MTLAGCGRVTATVDAVAGEIGDDDPRWLTNRPHYKLYAAARP